MKIRITSKENPEDNTGLVDLSKVIAIRKKKGTINSGATCLDIYLPGATAPMHFGTGGFKFELVEISMDGIVSYHEVDIDMVLTAYAMMINR